MINHHQKCPFSRCSYRLGVAIYSAPTWVVLGPPRHVIFLPLRIPTTSAGEMEYVHPNLIKRVNATLRRCISTHFTYIHLSHLSTYQQLEGEYARSLPGLPVASASPHLIPTLCTPAINYLGGRRARYSTQLYSTCVCTRSTDGYTRRLEINKTAPT